MDGCNILWKYESYTAYKMVMCILWISVFEFQFVGV